MVIMYLYFGFYGTVTLDRSYGAEYNEDGSYGAKYNEDRSYGAEYNEV